LTKFIKQSTLYLKKEDNNSHLGRTGIEEIVFPSDFTKHPLKICSKKQQLKESIPPNALAPPDSMTTACLILISG
jgi:hypothetical protein